MQNCKNLTDHSTHFPVQQTSHQITIHTIYQCIFYVFFIFHTKTKGKTKQKSIKILNYYQWDIFSFFFQIFSKLEIGFFSMARVFRMSIGKLSCIGFNLQRSIKSHFDGSIGSETLASKPAWKVSLKFLK